MRQNNINFINPLNNLSMGTMTDSDIQLFKSRCNLPNVLYDEIHLFFTNKDVEAYNDSKIQSMSGELFEHESVDHIQNTKKLNEKTVLKTLESFHKFPTNKTGCLPRRILTKIGAKLMITRNISTKEGLVNGATGVLRHVTRDKDSNETKIFWLEFEDSNIGRKTRSLNSKLIKENNLNKEWNLTPIFTCVVTDIQIGKKMGVQKQFSLVSAESVTVHKSRGQTYQSACVHNNKMTRMMQYVAYSRVTNLNNLFIVGDFKPPAPLDHTSDLKVELDRLNTEKKIDNF